MLLYDPYEYGPFLLSALFEWTYLKAGGGNKAFRQEWKVILQQIYFANKCSFMGSIGKIAYDKWIFMTHDGNEFPILLSAAFYFKNCSLQSALFS